MKVIPRIVQLLQARMLDELTAIDQYRQHLAKVTVWQLIGEAAYLQERIDDETRHFQIVRDWLVELGVEPVSGPLNRVNSGQDVEQMHLFDRTAEELAITNYEELLAACIEEKDFATFNVIQPILSDEVEHRRDVNARIVQTKQMGIQNYLSAQLTA